jgi:O-antigen ligase/polysaccharide polymerase Wzy-like membrane protein
VAGGGPLRRAAGGAGLRQALLAIGVVGVVAGAAGVTEQKLFHQPGVLKYALTIAAPLILIAVASTAQPLLVFVPLIVVAAPFASFTSTLQGTSVSLLAPVVIGAAVVAIATGRRPRRLSRAGSMVVPALLLLCVPFADGTDQGHYVVLFGTMILVGWLISRAGALPGGPGVVLWSLVASAALQAGLAIWEFHTNHLLNLYSSAGSNVFGRDYFFTYGTENRPIGSFSDPISLGNVLALSCPVALVLAATARSAVGRFAALVALFGASLALALSLSRMSWIGAAVGVAIAFVLLPGRYRWRAALTSSGLASIVIVLALGLSHSNLGQRFSSIFDPTAPTVRTRQGDQVRAQLWRAALASSRRHPIVGVGLGRLEPVLEHEVAGPQINAQSTYLQMLGEAGAAGLLALALVLWGLRADVAAGLRRDRVLYAGLAGALASVLITWLTDYTTQYVPVAATFAVVFGAIASRGARRDERPA